MRKKKRTPPPHILYRNIDLTIIGQTLESKKPEFKLKLALLCLEYGLPMPHYKKCIKERPIC